MEQNQSSSSPSFLLLDVRSEIEVEMCRLPGAINIPIHHFTDSSNSNGAAGDNCSSENPLRNTDTGSEDPFQTSETPFQNSKNPLQNMLDKHSGRDVIVICRRGNDSQLAVAHLRRQYPQLAVRDVIGGLHAWTRHIDPDFPVY
jgi:rhodanese-related sulfurtransferase